MFASYKLAALAWSNLRRRRRAYISFVIGIVLAVTFIAVISFFLGSLPASFETEHIRQNGYSDVVDTNVTLDQLAAYVENGWVESYGLAKVLGNFMPERSDTETSFNVASLDNKAMELLDLQVREGRLPESSGEIALEYGALGIMRQPLQIGDEFTLPLYLAAGDGKILGDKPYDYRFTLVGLVENKNTNFRFSAGFGQTPDIYDTFPYGFVTSGEVTVEGSIPVRTAYMTLTDAFSRAVKDMDQYAFRDRYMPNAMLLGYGLNLINRMSPYHLITAVILVSFVILALLIAAGIGIANSLSLILDERRQQIGLLRAVGATRRQLRQLYRRETFVITAMAIPVALLLAAGIVYLLGRLIDKFVFVFNPLVLASVALFSFLVIYAASYFPLKRAGAIPPMQAIRQTEARQKLTAKKPLSHVRQFVPERLLTARNLLLYKNRRIGITVFLVICLMLSVLLSFLAVSFYQKAAYIRPDFSLHEYNRMMADSQMLTYNYHAPGFSDSTLAQILSLPQVARVYAEKAIDIGVMVDRVTPYLNYEMHDAYNEVLPPGFTIDYTAGQKRFNEKYGFDSEFVQLPLVAVSEDALEGLAPYLYEGRIDLAAVNRGDAVLMYLPALQIFRDERTLGVQDVPVGTPSGPNRFVLENDTFTAGEPISLRLAYTDRSFEFTDEQTYDYMEALPDDVNFLEMNVTPVGFINSIDYQARQAGATEINLWQHAMVTTFAGLEAMGISSTYKTIHIYLDGTPDQATEDYLVSRLTDLTYETRNGELSNLLHWRRVGRNDDVAMLVSLAAVLIVFISIVVSMISHNMTARVRADRRVIGSMRAVGAPERVIQKSFFYQVLHYFALGSLIGYVLGAALAVYIGITAKIKLSIIPFVAPLVFAAIMLLISSVSVRKKVSRIFRQSIVDNIRQLAAILITVLGGLAIVLLAQAPVEAAAASPRLLITDYKVEGSDEAAVAAGDEATLTLTLQNMQAAQLARNIVVTLSDEDNDIVAASVASAYIDLMLALERTELAIPIRVLKEAAAGVKELSFTIDYQDALGGSLSSTQSVFLTIEAKTDDAKAGTPRLLVSGFSIEGSDLPDVRGGNDVQLNVRVTNAQTPSRTGSKAFSIVVSAVSDDSHIFTTGAASSFIEELAAGESRTLPIRLSVLDAVEPGPKKLTVSIAYENEKAAAFTASETIYLTAVQDVRLEHDALDYVAKLSQGNVSRIALNVMNMGKGDINNIYIRSNIPSISEGISGFAGTVKAGESKEVVLSIAIKDSVAPGCYDGAIDLFYEGQAGEVYTESLPVSLEVTAKPVLSLGENNAQKASAFSVVLIPLLIALGALTVILIIMLIIQAGRIRKLKRAEEARL